jgi:ABC-type uncharacterized transport system auxiliary subunit
MKMHRSLAFLLIVFCGCVSAPKVNYYTLAMETSGRTQTDHNLVVERFRTTEALGRNQILIYTSPTEIEYYAADQWAGGVGELVRQKLSEEFGPHVEGRKSLVVSGTVLAFEQVDQPSGTAARIKLQVVVRDADAKRYEKPVMEKTYAITRDATGPKPSAVVQTLSKCVEEIAAQIAEDL